MTVFEKTLHSGKVFEIHICDQSWEKLPLTHKDKYSEIRNLIIQ